MSSTPTLDDILKTSKRTTAATRGPVVLVDSDTIAFRAAAATDGRQYIVGKTAFKYKGDATKWCVDKGIDLSEIQIEFYPEPKAHAYKIVKNAIQGIRRYCNRQFPTYSMEFFHTSSTNFRNEILDGYKGNREDSRKPFHLDGCKAYVRKGFYTVEEEGLEADDLIGIRSFELTKEARPFIIVSNDKDMRTLPGRYYNWVKEEEIQSTPTDSMKFFYMQTLAGDTADNIPGVDGIGMNDAGTGRANKIIDAAYEEFCKTHEFEGPNFKLHELEEHLWHVCLDTWAEGGPGKKGNYGCIPYWEVQSAFERSARCLMILHNWNLLWMPPMAGWSNYAV